MRLLLVMLAVPGSDVIIATHKTPDTLVLQGSICRREYKLSADAQSMTAHVECHVDYDSRRILVYERLRGVQAKGRAADFSPAQATGKATAGQPPTSQ
jgi:hypothetical protein